MCVKNETDLLATRILNRVLPVNFELPGATLMHYGSEIGQNYVSEAVYYIHLKWILYLFFLNLTDILNPISKRKKTALVWKKYQLYLLLYCHYLLRHWHN